MYLFFEFDNGSGDGDADWDEWCNNENDNDPADFVAAAPFILSKIYNSPINVIWINTYINCILSTRLQYPWRSFWESGA